MIALVAETKNGAARKITLEMLAEARRLADANVNIEVAYLATNTRVAFVVPDVATAREAL